MEVPAPRRLATIAAGPKLTKADEIALEISERIDSGEYAPGSRLPTIGELAQSAGVSNATAQQAYKLLHLAGFVHGEQGRGTFVRGEPETTP